MEPILPEPLTYRKTLQVLEYAVESSDDITKPV